MSTSPFLSGSLASLASVTSFDMLSDSVSNVQPMEVLFNGFFGAGVSGMQKEGVVPFCHSFLQHGRCDNSSFKCCKSCALSAPTVEGRSGEFS